MEFSLFAKAFSTQKKREIMNENNGDKDPTFQEFISYLLQTPVEQYNEHWEPIALKCRLGDCENISEHENNSFRYKKMILIFQGVSAPL